LPLYTVTVNLPAALGEDQVGRFAETLGDTPLSTSLLRTSDPFHGPWRVQWLLDETPDKQSLIATLSLTGALQGIAVGDLVIEELPDDINWLEQSYRQFPPFAVGPFFIYGSHHTDPLPEGTTPLQIEAATAFGSGEHGTTSGCLILLDQLKQSGFNPGKILDMGCGSGILSIAARKLWDAPVLAVDIDPESVRVTKNHCVVNDVVVEAIAGDGFAVVNETYSLIIANILPQPLKAMANDIVTRTKSGGFIMLSGMLLDQAADVLAVYEGLGAKLHTRLDRGEWTALLLTPS
jgi:ribosomal protein L11 methyltransferase